MTQTTPALKDEGQLSPHDFVAHCQSTAAALLAVLGRERAALAGAPGDDVNQIFDDKARLADALDQLESLRRDRWPGETGVLTSLLAPEGLAQWQGYIDTLTACREANAINGRLVHARESNVREALAILRGTTDAAPATYDASGGRPDTLDPIALGSA